ncbi:hypothetical protein F4804DRAFT_349091 [Jackrogersella minutella]|nr:hypothetical protein F4804DRAFT_349091 [Jackrogersella minutella]
MAGLVTIESDFHPGEQAMHNLLRVQQRGNPTHHGLPPALAYRVAQSPLVAFAALDRRGRPWATVWGGEAGFCRPIAGDVLGVRALVDARFDPVVRELFAVKKGGKKGEDEDSREIVDDKVIRPEGGRIMAGLSIDLATRDRVKIAGRMVVGTMTRTRPGLGELQMALQVQESLGNCPKYLNKKQIVPHTPEPRLVASAGKGLPLPREAVELIRKADLFFIASKHGDRNMDANHRGGAPGFVRVLQNEGGGGGAGLVYPEYSGNRLYQTLGNLQLDPYAGLAFPDFETGDVLYLTGRTTILAGEKAGRVMPRARLAVRVDVDEAVFVRDALPFRGAPGEPSPYNPAVRCLACERDVPAAAGEASGVGAARLVRRWAVAPAVSRYVFRLAARGPLKAWLPGHHVTLDFAQELDVGYSHMRDDDPQSLNDDFVRTFTVSRPLDPGVVDGRGYIKEGVEPEFEITVRRHGPATRFLKMWNLRVPLEIPVLGFGGADGFRIPTEGNADGTSVFIAAGVGVTPLMAQAAGVLEANGRRGFRALWTLKAEDLPLAVDALEMIDGLGDVTRLFVTGEIDEEGRALVSSVQGLGAEVLERRIESSDVLSEGEKGKRKYYCCTGPEMMKVLLKWTEGEEVLYESFEY